jgi:hypothetical protein
MTKAKADRMEENERESSKGVKELHLYRETTIGKLLPDSFSAVDLD